MLPIAVLPIAGILLRLGQPDLLNLAPIAQAGQTIFESLALLFAVGIAVGFAKENHGVAGLAGAVGWLVLTAVMKSIDPKNDMGVLGGIVSGVVAGLLYNRYHDLVLPQFLAFFAGKRFVAIATGLASVVLGVVLGYAWPPIQHGIDGLGRWLTGAGGFGLFVYGVLNRLLLVTGLHHVLNSLVWFVFGSFTGADGKVATGDLNRFFAGDPTAGGYMAGFFPVMMFGLPAACLAMWHAAKERRRMVGGLLLSMALTSMLTGVTEPIEFTFLFLAPRLFVAHAILTGISMAAMHALHVRLGFTFSAGLFDYVLSYGKSENGWMALPFGLLYSGVYYGVFRWAIERFDLATLGRRDEPAASDAFVAKTGGERGRRFVAALGGATNLRDVDACMTRLRLQVADAAKLDDAALRGLGARGVVRIGGGSVQVILGPEADGIASEIRAALRGATTATVSDVRDVPDASGSAEDLGRWQAALGGRANVRTLERVAGTRIRAEVADVSMVDDTALANLGASGVMRLRGGVVHVITAALRDVRVDDHVRP